MRNPGYKPNDTVSVQFIDIIYCKVGEKVGILKFSVCIDMMFSDMDYKDRMNAAYRAELL
jgi:hypothetical protein